MSLARLFWFLAFASNNGTSQKCKTRSSLAEGIASVHREPSSDLNLDDDDSLMLAATKNSKATVAKGQFIFLLGPRSWVINVQRPE